MINNAQSDHSTNTSLSFLSVGVTLKSISWKADDLSIKMAVTDTIVNYHTITALTGTHLNIYHKTWCCAEESQPSTAHRILIQNSSITLGRTHTLLEGYSRISPSSSSLRGVGGALDPAPIPAPVPLPLCEWIVEAWLLWPTLVLLLLLRPSWLKKKYLYLNWWSWHSLWR